MHDSVEPLKIVLRSEFLQSENSFFFCKVANMFVPLKSTSQANLKERDRLF